jgi:hypothetical protein
MAQDNSRLPARVDPADLELYGSVPVAPYQPRYPIDNVPDWAVARPPFDPDSKIQLWWSRLLTLPRALAIGFLLVTVNWWRSAILLLLMGLLALALLH